VAALTRLMPGRQRAAWRGTPPALLRARPWAGPAADFPVCRRGNDWTFPGSIAL